MTPARAPPQCLTSSYALGILFLFLVSLLWTACSIVVQHLYQDMEFDSPFLIVYIGTSLFSVFLPMRLGYERRRWLRESFGVFRRCCCGCCCAVPGGEKEESESSDVAALEEEEERAVIIPWRHPPGGRTAVPLSDRSDWGLASLSDEDADDTTVLVRSGISAYQKDELRVAGGRAAAVATAAAGAVEMKGSSWNDFRYEEDEEVEEKTSQNSTAESNAVSNNSHPQPTRRGNQTHHNRQLYQHYLLSHQDHISMASKVAPLWFLSNYFYAQSLQWTSIASSTVLASMGSLFAFGFATCSKFGDERVTRGKILGVLLCFFGGVATAWTDVDGTALDTNEGDDVDGVDGVDDQSQQLHHRYDFFIRLLRHPAASPTLPRFISNITQNDSFLALLGDMAGLLSAVGYGAYTVLIRHLCPKDEDRMSMQLLFGYIGVWNMVLLFPAALWVAWPSDDIHRGVSANDSHIKIWSDDSPPYSSNDVDPSEPTTTMNAPHSTLTWSIFLFLLLKGLLDNVLSDYLWARAVILTSATVASVGVGLTIPMAFVADWIMGNYKERSVGWGDVLGAVFVLLGFLFVNVNVFGEKGWDDGEGEEGNDDDEDEEEEEERLEFEMEDGMTAGSAHDVNILT